VTTIVAVSNGKRAWIGADLCASHGDICTYDNDKLIRCGHFVFGCSGMASAKDLLRAFRTKLAKARSVYEFAGLVHWVLLKNKYKMIGTDDDDPKWVGALDILLVAESGNVFVLSDGVRITKPATGVVASIGSGCEFAVGAGNALLRVGRMKPGRDVVEAAIVEACRWDRSSGGKPHVLEVK